MPDGSRDGRPPLAHPRSPSPTTDRARRGLRGGHDRPDHPARHMIVGRPSAGSSMGQPLPLPRHPTAVAIPYPVRLRRAHRRRRHRCGLDHRCRGEDHRRLSRAGADRGARADPGEHRAAPAARQRAGRRGRRRHRTRGDDPRLPHRPAPSSSRARSCATAAGWARLHRACGRSGQATGVVPRQRSGRRLPGEAGRHAERRPPAARLGRNRMVARRSPLPARRLLRLAFPTPKASIRPPSNRRPPDGTPISANTSWTGTTHAAQPTPRQAAVDFGLSAVRHACLVCGWDPDLAASAEGIPPPLT